MYRLSIVTSASSAAIWPQFLIKSFKLNGCILETVRDGID